MKPTSLLQILVLGLLSSARAPLTEAQASRPPQAAPGEAVPTRRVVFEGFVCRPDGVPAEGVVVVSSAGGTAVTDGSGWFELESEVPCDAAEVEVMALASAQDQRRAASARIAPGSGPRATLPGPLVLAAGAGCTPRWLPTFGPVPGVVGNPSNGLVSIRDFVVHDDGSGPALFVAGDFVQAGPVAALHVAKWDGASWSALGSGLEGEVWALAVYDDGSGPALFAGGYFGSEPVRTVARWDGASWTALPSGSGTGGPGNRVLDLAVYDDGGGPDLYASGQFNTGIRRWDGSSWSSVGGGLFGASGVAVYSMAVYGGSLYAGGYIDSAGSVIVSGIARWNGSNWSRVTSGVDGYVAALLVHDDGSGSALFVCGSFTTAGGLPASSIAKWNGTSWAPLGSGVAGDLAHRAQALARYDDGNGPVLYVAGRFTSAGGLPASNFARWDGTSWSAPAAGPRAEVRALAVFDAGNGPALYLGGDEQAIRAWDGLDWSAAGGGLDDRVLALVSYDDGSGPALHAGGTFTLAGSSEVQHIAKWNGTGWSSLGEGTNDSVNALATFDDGGGLALHAGGVFTQAGGTPVGRVARWDGSSWSPLGSGVGGGWDPLVRALAVFDDGGGPALYVAGSFTHAGGIPSGCIGRWNGSSWSSVGGGVSDLPNLLDPVRVSALAVHDDGSGPALYAGGKFTTAGGVAVDNIARWDGASWTPVSGLTWVDSLTVFDEGSGPRLFAAGANGVTRWDGVAWSLVGLMNSLVNAVAVHDDGSGPALYAGGRFTTVGGLAASRVARWDGSEWSPLGTGLSADRVWVLAEHDDGSGPVLLAGGSFGLAPDSGDSFLARWSCERTPPELFCPPSVEVLDRLGSAPGELVNYTVTASDAEDPQPTLVCIPPSGSFFPRGTTLVTCTATDAAGNQATCQFPVTVTLKARRR